MKKQNTARISSIYSAFLSFAFSTDTVHEGLWTWQLYFPALLAGTVLIRLLLLLTLVAHWISLTKNRRLVLEVLFAFLALIPICHPKLWLILFLCALLTSFCLRVYFRFKSAYCTSPYLFELLIHSGSWLHLDIWRPYPFILLRRNLLHQASLIIFTFST